MVIAIKRILIIGEEEGFAKHLLLSALEREGYTVKSVLYGKGGAEKLPDASFDAIIIDTKIPLIDNVKIITNARNLT